MISAVGSRTVCGFFFGWFFFKTNYCKEEKRNGMEETLFFFPHIGRDHIMNFSVILKV